ncbi:MAG: hypothetical protein WKG07_31360 [Hymenobacter sp.]
MASKFLLVAQREYLTRVRKRAFIVLTLLVPLLRGWLWAVRGQNRAVGRNDRSGGRA